MDERPTLANEAFRTAFEAHERDERINTGKLASALVTVLMPLGTMVDCPAADPGAIMFW